MQCPVMTNTTILSMLLWSLNRLIEHNPVLADTMTALSIISLQVFRGNSKVETLFGSSMMMSHLISSSALQLLGK